MLDAIWGAWRVASRQHPDLILIQIAVRSWIERSKTGLSQELEVFHNPLAQSPIAHSLLPGATHWFERNGQIECSSMWEWSVLASISHIRVEKLAPNHEQT